MTQRISTPIHTAIPYPAEPDPGSVEMRAAAARKPRWAFPCSSCHRRLAYPEAQDGRTGKATLLSLIEDAGIREA